MGMTRTGSKKVSVPQWLAVGAGVLAVANLFLPWIRVDIDMPGLAMSQTQNAFASFWAWAAMFLLVAAAAVALMPALGGRFAGQPLMWLGLACVSFLFVIITTWVATFSVRGVMEDMRAELGVRGPITDPMVEQAERMIDVSPSVGQLVGLALTFVSLAGAYLWLRTAPRVLPPR